VSADDPVNSQLIVKHQTCGVNLVDRDVNVDVVRVVMDDAHALMFSASQLLAKTLLDQAQRFGIGISPALRGNSPRSYLCWNLTDFNTRFVVRHSGSVRRFPLVQEGRVPSFRSDKSFWRANGV
jgi:hypothetical protein